MWSVLCLVAAVTAFTAWGKNDDAIMAKGQWMVRSLNECPDPDKYPNKIDVKKRKINRTHDAFSAWFTVPEEINLYSHGIHIDVCKKVDGGCKPQYTFDESSFCNFIKQYAEDNFRAALTNAGLENPDCPIPEGKLTISDFIFNYLELPEDGMRGKFTATSYITQNGVQISCNVLDLDFIEKDDDDYDEE